LAGTFLSVPLGPKLHFGDGAKQGRLRLKYMQEYRRLFDESN